MVEDMSFKVTAVKHGHSIDSIISFKRLADFSVTLTIVVLHGLHGLHQIAGYSTRL